MQYDESSATVAKLLVQEMVNRHEVPSEILSDHDLAFLSGLMKDMEALLRFHEVKTSFIDGWLGGVL